MKIKDILEMAIRTDADYQRPFVWDKKTRDYLLSSVFNGKSLGTIVVQIRDIRGKGANLNDAVSYLVDAVQRMTTIKGFLSGLYRTPEDLTVTIKKEVIDIGNMSYSDILELPKGKEILSTIYDRNISVRIGYMTPEEAADEFRRTNAGIPLKPSMHRNAMKGILRDLICEYGTGETHMSQYTSIPTKEKGYDQDEALAMVFAHIYQPYKIKATELSSLYLSYIDTPDAISREDKSFTEAEYVFRDLIDKMFEVLAFNSKSRVKTVNKLTFVDMALLIDIFRGYELKDPEKLLSLINILFDGLASDEVTYYPYKSSYKSWKDIKIGMKGLKTRFQIISREVLKRPEFAKCFKITSTQLTKVKKDVYNANPKLDTREMR